MRQLAQDLRDQCLNFAVMGVIIGTALFRPVVHEVHKAPGTSDFDREDPIGLILLRGLRVSVDAPGILM